MVDALYELSAATLEELVVTEPPVRHTHNLVNYQLVGCGDVRPPDEASITGFEEPYYRFFGGRDGIMNVIATARHMSDPTFHVDEAATHENDGEIMEALFYEGLWPVNHWECKALSGRQAVGEAVATHDEIMLARSTLVLPSLTRHEYKDVVSAESDLVKAGRVHTPAAVIAHNDAVDRERPFLPQHPMMKLRTIAGMHAVGMVVNRRTDSMLLPTHLSGNDRPELPPVYGIDAHLTDRFYEAIRPIVTVDHRALEVATAVHAGVIATEFVKGPNNLMLPIYAVD